MLEPKARKYRKDFRGRMRGKSLRGAKLSFGEFGLKSQDRGWLSNKEIEAGRRAITNSLKRGGRVWIRVFPDKPISSRPSGQRMGGGKGDIDRYVAVVKPGKIIYEIAGVTLELAKDALEKASAKLSLKTRMINRVG